jgi:2-succinyl-5-enolpyruvyl-6-hydroxy-3-cyclohexene-1-carboxylate synthase
MLHSSEEEMYANPTYAYVGAFVDELQRMGVHHAVICPGSRSTPLALTFAEQAAIQTWMHVDERSAAFFALGLAKRLQQPVAILCTSGTAAANFLPAIVEAKLTHVPLLVLTADRPHELRENGAPQSIDQNRLYGTHVKWFVEVALPEATNAAMRYIRTLADRATALTQAVPAGPVHLNFPFREPLVPDPIGGQPLPPLAQRDALAWQGRPANMPYVAVHELSLSATTVPSLGHVPVEVEQLATRLQSAQRGLIVVGPSAEPALVAPLLTLACTLGYPILADPLSQLRCGEHRREQILTSYDAFLRLDSFVKRAQPELILRFGATPTSKPVLQYMQHYTSCPQIVVESQASWDEPTQLASTFIHADPAALCVQLNAALEENALVNAWQGREERIDIRWLHFWQKADLVTRQTLRENMQAMPVLFEGRAFAELAELLPEQATLYVGNSMPVRDLDTFFWGNKRPIQILGNRGANGIDGVVSSALGASAAARAQHSPTVLVLGDLSFFHDLNGLLAARLHQLDITIVLINNDGGGIFSFLPQAAHPKHFEQLFGTPTDLDFRLAVQMYSGHFQRVEQWEQFREAIMQSMARGGLHVIEVRTERESNVRLHRQLWRAVEQALQRI